MTGSSMTAYAAIAIVMVIVGAITGTMLILAHAVRPARRGPLKDETYESGMPVVGDARGRFNVRFYLVAMLFLLFDVEVVFMWPAAVVFYKTAKGGGSLALREGTSVGAGFLLAVLGVFAAFLVVGFAYEWRRGVFRWD